MDGGKDPLVIDGPTGRLFSQVRLRRVLEAARATAKER